MVDAAILNMELLKRKRDGCVMLDICTAKGCFRRFQGRADEMNAT